MLHTPVVAQSMFALDRLNWLPSRQKVIGAIQRLAIRNLPSLLQIRIGMLLAVAVAVRPMRWRPSRQKVVDAIQRLAIRGLPSLSQILIVMLLVVAVVVLPLMSLWLFTKETISWFPTGNAAGTLLGSLLASQAAIAALSLAVTLFIMQSVSTRRDADDRVYIEYIRRSWARPIFSASIGSVLATGILLIAETFFGDSERATEAGISVRNLTPLAAIAFVTNLVCAVALFERAVRRAHPGRWRELRMYVNKRDVRESVHAFISSRGNEDSTGASAEGSADQAIRALLDDARSAMTERRHGDFQRSLDSIEELVAYAMDEMEQSAIPLGAPGSQPAWPPLRELERSLYSFSEEVIRDGTRECVFALLKLDYWAVFDGMRRSREELFTVGLNGYQWNYEIATHIGVVEFHDLLRDRFSLNLPFLTFGHQPETAFPFLQKAVQFQERMLSHSMHAKLPDDYEQLHDGFGSALSDALDRWTVTRRASPEEDRLKQSLEQRYRIALMGLAGRAIDLADSGESPDANLYLEPARRMYTSARQLGDDIREALAADGFLRFPLWAEWERPARRSRRAYSMHLERYPLTFLAVRIMELAEDPSLVIDLGGYARQTLDWFLPNSEPLERFVQDTPTLSAHQRGEIATEILREAVRRDEIEEDRQIIRRELSNAKTAAFKSSVLSGAIGHNPIERLFERAGAFLQLASNINNAPEERGFPPTLLPKAYFVDAQQHDRTHYAPVEGDQWGRGLSLDALYLLCEALEGATLMTARLDSLDDLLRAIDVVVEDLAPQDHVAVVLAGDWGEIPRARYGQEPEEYEPYWMLTAQDTIGEIGRYRGLPIFTGPENGERRLYVVDVDTFGSYERTQSEDGHNVRVDVKPISQERAQELLQVNPNYFSDEPDQESRLRKLQAHVEMSVLIRHRFRVADHSRARRIIPSRPVNPESGITQTRCSS